MLTLVRFARLQFYQFLKILIRKNVSVNSCMNELLSEFSESDQTESAQTDLLFRLKRDKQYVTRV